MMRDLWDSIYTPYRCVLYKNTKYREKAPFLGEKNSVWVLTKKNMILLNCTPNFLLFPFFQLFSTKNAENYYFDQCLGLRSTQTLVEIYNILLSLTQSQTLFLALLAAELKAVCSDNNCIFLLCSLLLRIYFLVVWIKGKLSKSDQMRLLTGTSWEVLLPDDFRYLWCIAHLFLWKVFAMVPPKNLSLNWFKLVCFVRWKK